MLRTSLFYWLGSLTLSDSAREELVFWEKNLRKLNGFAISPITPSIASCEIIAGDASGCGLYAAKFSGSNDTIYSRKLTPSEMAESSTFRECLTIFGIYTDKSSSQIHKFSRRNILHLTDNKGVVSVFSIGSPRPKLQSMAVAVYRAANRLNLKLFFEWKPRTDPLLKLVARF